MKTNKKLFSLFTITASAVSVLTPMVSTGCVSNSLINIGEIETQQFFGFPKTYNIHPKSELKDVKFSYSDDSIISASWEGDKVTVSPKCMGSTILGITATDINGKQAFGSVHINVESPVHEFINDRTIALRYVSWVPTDEDGSSWNLRTFVATGWLFYHETTNVESDYTYYLLTNNHVTSGFNELLNLSSNMPFDKTHVQNISFAYQDWNGAKGETEVIPYESVSTDGKPNEYNVLDEWWSNNVNIDRFSTLYTSYMDGEKIYTITEEKNEIDEETGEKKVKMVDYTIKAIRNYYQDMSICKIDFRQYANTEFGTRLRKLNEYASKHNNRLVEFDDYSDIDSSTRASLFVGGYPLTYNDDELGYISEDGVKFQKQVFENVTPQIFPALHSSMMFCDNAAEEMEDKITKGQMEPTDHIYGTTGELGKNSYRLSPEWMGDINTNQWLKFGSGGSGSLAMTAADPLNPDTYKASAIYRGRAFPDTFGWCTSSRFLPFTYNFGKNLEDIPGSWNFVERFYNSDAFKRRDVQVNECYYHFSYKNCI